MDVWSQDRADHKKRIKRSNGTKGTASSATEDIRELKGNLHSPLTLLIMNVPIEFKSLLNSDQHNI
jgi:hypothetical protein